MNPKQTIKELHRIASTLNNSKQPNKNLVLNELNKLVYRIASDEDTAEDMVFTEANRVYDEAIANGQDRQTARDMRNAVFNDARRGTANE